MSSETSSGPSLLMRLLAVIVLIVAAYILLKAVIGLVSFLLWPVMAILAIIAVVWAINTLR